MERDGRPDARARHQRRWRDPRGLPAAADRCGTNGRRRSRRQTGDPHRSPRRHGGPPPLGAAHQVNLAVWSEGPTLPGLPLGEVHVWVAGLTGNGSVRDRLLSADERERRGRILVWTGRSTGDARGRSCASWRGATSTGPGVAAAHRGRPRQAGDHRRSAWAALQRLPLRGARAVRVRAGARGGRRRRDARAQQPGACTRSARVRTRAEQATGAARPAERGAAFLSEWARHEAAVKCHGGGLAAAAHAEAELRG